MSRAPSRRSNVLAWSRSLVRPHSRWGMLRAVRAFSTGFLARFRLSSAKALAFSLDDSDSVIA
eukprot:6988685-Pyramimonas_sp.AAC.1